MKIKEVFKTIEVFILLRPPMNYSDSTIFKEIYCSLGRQTGVERNGAYRKLDERETSPALLHDL